MTRYVDPFPQYYDGDLAYAFGTVYFGEANQDPVANPKPPFSDPTFLTPITASQVLDDKGMFATPIFLEGNYSVSLFDVLNNQIRTDPLLSGTITSLPSNIEYFDTVADMVASITLEIGQVVATLGYASTGDGGDNTYEVVSTATGVDDGGSFIDLTGTGHQAMASFPQGLLKFNQFGFNGNTSIQNCINFGVANNMQITGNAGSVHVLTGAGVTIPSNCDIDGRGAIFRNLGTINNVFCFQVDRTTSNIKVQNCVFQGPYYLGGTVAYNQWNCGFIVFGSFYRDFDPITNLIRPSPLAFASPGENISVNNCDFTGFAMSGMEIDDITNFIGTENRINHCGRDGIRGYGLFDSIISDNRIRDLSPGEGGIAPNLNVYGVTLTRRFADPVSEYRRTERTIVANNVINEVYTWKSLDTHGSLDCIFQDNVCTDSHIGMGIAQGSGDGLVISENTIVTGNIFVFRNNPDTIPRAGVTDFAGTFGTGLNTKIHNNLIEGYGQDVGDGAITISRQESCIVTGNTIVNSLKAGITVINPGSVHIADNYIKDVRTDSAPQNIGISIQNDEVNAYIANNTFHNANESALDGISMANPSTGFEINVSSDNHYINCDSEIIQPNRVNAGTFKFKVRGSANVNNSGTAIFIDSNGFLDTINRISLGLVEYTTTYSFFSISTLLVFPEPKSLTDVIFGVQVIDETTFRIQTRNTAGILVDTGYVFTIAGY